MSQLKNEICVKHKIKAGSRKKVLLVEHIFNSLKPSTQSLTENLLTNITKTSFNDQTSIHHHKYKEVFNVIDLFDKFFFVFSTCVFFFHARVFFFREKNFSYRANLIFFFKGFTLNLHILSRFSIGNKK